MDPRSATIAKTNSDELKCHEVNAMSVLATSFGDDGIDVPADATSALGLPQPIFRGGPLFLILFTH